MTSQDQPLNEGRLEKARATFMPSLTELQAASRELQSIALSNGELHWPRGWLHLCNVAAPTASNATEFGLASSLRNWLEFELVVYGETVPHRGFEAGVREWIYRMCVRWGNLRLDPGGPHTMGARQAIVIGPLGLPILTRSGEFAVADLVILRRNVPDIVVLISRSEQKDNDEAIAAIEYAVQAGALSIYVSWSGEARVTDKAVQVIDITKQCQQILGVN